MFSHVRNPFKRGNIIAGRQSKRNSLYSRHENAESKIK